MAAHRVRQPHHPVNPETVVEAVSKTLPAAPPRIKFTSLTTIEEAIESRCKGINFRARVNDLLNRKRGRV